MYHTSQYRPCLHVFLSNQKSGVLRVVSPEIDVKAVFIDQGKAAKKAGTEGRVYLITKVPGGIDLSPISVEDAKLC